MSSYKYRGQTGCPQDIYLFLAFLSVWPNELFFLLHMVFLCPCCSLSTKCPQLASTQCLLEQSSSFSTLWSAGPVLGQCGTNQCWCLWGQYIIVPGSTISLELQAGIYYDYWDPRNHTKFLIYSQQTQSGHQNPLKWRFRPRPRKYLAYFFRTLLKNRDSVL